MSPVAAALPLLRRAAIDLRAAHTAMTPLRGDDSMEELLFEVHRASRRLTILTLELSRRCEVTE